VVAVPPREKVVTMVVDKFGPELGNLLIEDLKVHILSRPRWCLRDIEVQLQAVVAAALEQNSTAAKLSWPLGPHNIPEDRMVSRRRGLRVAVGMHLAGDMHMRMDYRALDMVKRLLEPDKGVVEVISLLVVGDTVTERMDKDRRGDMVNVLRQAEVLRSKDYKKVGEDCVQRPSGLAAGRMK